MMPELTEAIQSAAVAIVGAHTGASSCLSECRVRFLHGFGSIFFGPKKIHSKYKIAFFALIVSSKEMPSACM